MKLLCIGLAITLIFFMFKYFAVKLKLEVMMYHYVWKYGAQSLPNEKEIERIASFIAGNTVNKIKFKK